jgi:hypothetical protein
MTACQSFEGFDTRYMQSFGFKVGSLIGDVYTSVSSRHVGPRISVMVVSPALKRLRSIFPSEHPVASCVVACLCV